VANWVGERYKEKPISLDNARGNYAWLTETAIPWIKQEQELLGLGQIGWGLWRATKAVAVLSGSAFAAATVIGAPLGMMGATYASYHLVGAAGNITSGIFNIFEGLRNRFFNEHNNLENGCPDSE